MCHACDERYAATLRSLTRRDVLRRLAIGGAALTLTGCKALTSPMSSDLTRVFLARRVHTMDSSNAVVEAVATHGGRITAVGSKRDVLAKVRGRREVFDLGSRSLLPGFIDPHMHSNFASLRPWLDVSPFTTSDLDAARTKIRAAAQAAGPGDWVQAKMLDPSLQQGKPLDRRELDAICGDVPVFVLESNGHVAYTNSRGLELAGVTQDTPDPPQARFVRDATGEPTGRLEEPPAFQPFVKMMPTPSQEQLVGFLRADLVDGARKGCTTLHDCGIGGLFADADIDLLDAVMATKPPVRYAGMLVSTHMALWERLGLRPGPRESSFTITGIKAWADGSNQGKTGYLRAPYLGSDERGALNYTPEEILNVIRHAHSAGWQLGVHANGDAAIDTVLDAIEQVLQETPRQDHRHRIEHASLLRPEHIRRMAQLGVSPSFLIGHVHYWGRAFRDRLFGAERAMYLDPCASAIAGGLRISLHSDYNVTPIDPLRCIQNAVVRDMREGGGVLAPHECITVEQGLRAMTIDAAWQCQLDDVCGSIEVGKAADFVALAQDPLEVVPASLQDIEVHGTWIDAEPAFVTQGV